MTHGLLDAAELAHRLQGSDRDDSYRLMAGVADESCLLAATADRCNPNADEVVSHYA